MEQQKIAIGKTVMGSKETLLAIIPREDGIIIQTMNYEDEIKDIPKSYKKQEINEQELKMAKTLVNSMDTPFDPEAYHDEYQVKLKKLLEDKIAGKEIVTPESTERGNVIDLMEALKMSIEQNKKTSKGGGKKKVSGE